MRGLWSGERGLSGFYARSLEAVRDDVFNWYAHDVSPAIAQADLVVYTMTLESGASPSLDFHASRALQGLGPYAQASLHVE